MYFNSVNFRSNQVTNSPRRVDVSMESFNRFVNQKPQECDTFSPSYCKPKCDKQPFAKFEGENQANLIYDEKSGKFYVKAPFLGGKFITVEEAQKMGMHSLNLDTVKLKGIDFRKHPEVLELISFDENTFENCKLPEGYSPQKIMELGKDPGLNIRKINSDGITGKGVNVAVIDWQLNSNKNYNSNVKGYEEMNNAKSGETFHAAAVTSIIGGKETGVAPDCSIYNFAAGCCGSRNMGDDQVQALKRILEINKDLPLKDRIRVVSISAPNYAGKEFENLSKELEKQGCWVFTSGKFWENFGYLEKKNPLGNPDDFNNYKICNGGSDEEDTLFINSGNRTVSGSRSETGFRHDSKASASWAIPVVSGLYVCACQIDPNITPQKFIEAARKTAHINYEPRKEMNVKDSLLWESEKLARTEIAQKLYPNLSMEEIYNSEEKWKKVGEVLNEPFYEKDKNGNKVINEEKRQQYLLSYVKPKIDNLKQTGKIDDNFNYLNPNREVKIIDAKKLMEYIKLTK